MAPNKVLGHKPRQQTADLIDELLQERKQMWSLYCSVAGLEPFSEKQPIETKLNEFCQILVDYISLGHFGIYRRIADGEERRRKVLELAEHIYPQIEETTEIAVSFNDKYEKLQGEKLLKNLSTDLSLLGETLASRIDLEDQLIKSLMH